SSGKAGGREEFVAQWVLGSWTVSIAAEDFQRNRDRLTALRRGENEERSDLQDFSLGWKRHARGKRGRKRPCDRLTSRWAAKLEDGRRSGWKAEKDLRRRLAEDVDRTQCPRVVSRLKQLGC
ncbi:MAG: hypothetical protein ACR2OO_00110, partial [Thermomicrobiales bacterium]